MADSRSPIGATSFDRAWLAAGMCTALGDSTPPGFDDPVANAEDLNASSRSHCNDDQRIDHRLGKTRIVDIVRRHHELRPAAAQDGDRAARTTRDSTIRAVLDAMRRVPREQFVPAFARAQGERHCALPIGYEQTISQPYTVAFMCQEARLRRRHGARGRHRLRLRCGRAGELVQAVHTVERIEPLYQAAAERLARLGYDNVRVHLDDGSLGLIRDSPSTRSSAPPAPKSCRPPTKTNSPTAAGW